MVLLSDCSQLNLEEASLKLSKVSNRCQLELLYAIDEARCITQRYLSSHKFVCTDYEMFLCCSTRTFQCVCQQLKVEIWYCFRKKVFYYCL